MTVSNTDESQAPAPGWVRRVGGVCVVAWVAIGLVTVFLDPRGSGAGIIDLFGGVGAWMAAGVGLVASALASFAVYRRRGAPIGLGAGLLCLAAVGAAWILIDWNAVTQGVLTLVVGVGLVLLFLRGGKKRENIDCEYAPGVFGDEDGLRVGHSGFGYYVGNYRIDDDY